MTDSQYFADSQLFGGDVLLNSPAEKWRKQRRILTKCFHPDTYWDAINGQCNSMIEILKLKLKQQQSPEILWRQHASAVSGDISSVLLFGQDFNAHQRLCHKTVFSQHYFSCDKANNC